MHYRARCLATLRAAYVALDATTRARIDARLAGFGIVEALQAKPVADVPLIDSALAIAPQRLGLAQRLRYYFSGTPWNPAP